MLQGWKSSRALILSSAALASLGVARARSIPSAPHQEPLSTAAPPFVPAPDADCIVELAKYAARYPDFVTRPAEIQALSERYFGKPLFAKP